jgi:hypothetical protein
MTNPNFKGVTDVEELLKLIYDEADHILGTAKEYSQSTTGNPYKAMSMIRADAKVIQQYAKRAMKTPKEEFQALMDQVLSSEGKKKRVPVRR